MPGSATPVEQIELADIGAQAIVAAVEMLIGGASKPERRLDVLVDDESMESFPATALGGP
jgi:hypothetical protein